MKTAKWVFASAACLCLLVTGGTIGALEYHDWLKRDLARDRLAGQLWGSWVQKADRTPLEAGWTGDAAALTALPGAPGRAGLREDNPRGDMQFGSILVSPDRTLECPSTDPDEYLCEHVAVSRFRPADGTDSFTMIDGALASGLRAVFAVGDDGVLQPGGEIVRHAATIEKALGGLEPGDLVTTAHVAIPHCLRIVQTETPATSTGTRRQVGLDTGGSPAPRS